MGFLFERAEMWRIEKALKRDPGNEEILIYLGRIYKKIMSNADRWKALRAEETQEIQSITSETAICGCHCSGIAG